VLVDRLRSALKGLEQPIAMRQVLLGSIRLEKAWATFGSISRRFSCEPIGGARQRMMTARRSVADGNLPTGELTEVIEVEQGCPHRTIYRRGRNGRISSLRRTKLVNQAFPSTIAAEKATAVPTLPQS
jgi:hypothetical protein